MIIIKIKIKQHAPWPTCHLPIACAAMGGCGLANSEIRRELVGGLVFLFFRNQLLFAVKLNQYLYN